ncbi:hypothetical protein CgunFtcFv8_018207 [Champsocephalus gunnari]|uniref:Uncharacterized protein n=1 Tax=Champsocephalus gunnari TaxID=52237 RepID=A0AAN8HS11_CHAGU|nr:hypothetical protein CgunFtcFv8_018207 [Champsocephalus gunnari]
MQTLKEESVRASCPPDSATPCKHELPAQCVLLFHGGTAAAGQERPEAQTSFMGLKGEPGPVHMRLVSYGDFVFYQMTSGWI